MQFRVELTPLGIMRRKISFDRVTSYQLTHLVYDQPDAAFVDSMPWSGYLNIGAFYWRSLGRVEGAAPETRNGIFQELNNFFYYSITNLTKLSLHTCYM